MRESVKSVAWGAIWIVGAFCFWLYLVGNPLDELALIQRGQTVPGFIVDTWEDAESGDEGGTQWFHAAVYKYRLPDGREFTRRTKDNSGRLKDEFRDLKQPYPIQVEYLPDAPNISRIKGDGHDTIWGWLLYKVGLGTLLLALFLSPGIIMVRNTLRDSKRVRVAGKGTTNAD